MDIIGHEIRYILVWYLIIWSDDLGGCSLNYIIDYLLKRI